VKGRGAHIETSLLECALALQEGAMLMGGVCEKTYLWAPNVKAGAAAR
jgi:hypothetical protein